MNNKGNTDMIGVIIITFVAIIVGLALFNGGITSNVASTTETITISQQTLTAGAVNVSINLNGRAVEGTPVVINSTNGSDVATSNFTFANNQIVNGVLTSTMTTIDGAIHASQPVNLTYTYQPDGYIDSAGGRSLASLIVIFAALAIAVVSIIGATKSGMLELFKS